MESRPKTAMVTGCAHARGFGRAIARHLAAAGANLVLVDVTDGAEKSDDAWRGLASVRAEVEALGRQALTTVADVTSWRQVEETVLRAVDHFGRLDILINNAAAPNE